MNQEPLALTIRIAQPQDASALIHVSQEVGSQTPYLTFDRLGIQLSVEQEAMFIEKMAAAENSLLILAEVEDQIVGIANVTQGPTHKQAHVGELGICLSQDFWGYGIASQMMDMLMEFAHHSGLAVLTLEVVQENERAIHLYKKFGFQQVGKLSKRLKVDDTLNYNLKLATHF